jgi:hypothetical protein
MAILEQARMLNMGIEKYFFAEDEDGSIKCIYELRQGFPGLARSLYVIKEW